MGPVAKTAHQTHYGFKRITSANWKDPDLTLGFPGLKSRYWMSILLKPKIGPNVPKEIAALFEVARGALIYGWFFYPLITLGAEQCSRVLEAGIKACCKMHGIPLKKENKYGKLIDTKYLENVQSLIKHGVIPGGDWELQFWRYQSNYRNQVSHPECQEIQAPMSNWHRLKETAERLNKLFP